MSQTDIVGNPKYRSTKPPSPNPHIFPIGPIIPIGPINPIHRDHHRGFFHSRRNRPIGHPTPSAHRPGSPIQDLGHPRTLHTWYVGAIAHGNSTARLNQAVTGSPTRSGYTPDFELFPSAIGCCRFLIVTDNHQKARSRPLPAIAVARRVGALRVLKDYYSHFFASRTTSPLSGNDFLRTTSALPNNTHWFAPKQKLLARSISNQP